MLKKRGQFNRFFHSTIQSGSSSSEWLKSKAVRKMLDISVGSLQNLRVTEKVRFKKVLGSYYYNREDLQKLFSDEPRQ